MAGTRGRLHKPPAAAAPRRSMRRKNTANEDADVPAVFQDMLHEDGVSKTAGDDEDRKPLKKRKTTQSEKTQNPVLQPQIATPAPSRAPEPLLPSPQPVHDEPLALSNAPSRTRAQPTVVDASRNGRVVQTVIDSDESDDSDIEWEDALGDASDSDDHQEDAEAAPAVGDVSIRIGASKTVTAETKRRIRRRAITSVDKKRRLDIHKMHILCLLYHVHRRNAWCNDERVHATLRKLVPSKILSNLVPNPDLTQYSASKRFVDALNELKILWSKRFKATAQGMSKPRWAEADAEIRPFSDFDELDSPMDKDDFRTAAHTLQGSQDVGAQLCCAMLRSIGIDARLVCSLQELPFASAAQPSTPQKPTPQKKTVVVDPYNKQDGDSSRPTTSHTPTRPKKLSRLERVMGERHPILNKAGTAPRKPKAFHSPYPVYWVEAFNSAHQKWVPLDPLSTFTVNSPEKLEPPLSFASNSLTYAIAFDEDCTAKDVTRRYAKAYNAKTRKFRVECTPHGEDWWNRTMKFFTRRTQFDRDQVEDAALVRKVAAEGIPKNVQDFKGHPIYVLERHLKHNEVIHPMEPVGKVNVGTGMKPKLEPIYRRKNVHITRSADKWYRMGRDVKPGEQPLKHAKPKKGRQLSIGPDTSLDDQQEEIGAGLYAEFQTELYVPPAVVGGRVPRNVYGNLDLYVPSMCPPGGLHIRHKLASKAARVVGVDYADAVTGFSFKGRHGTAIVQGVVVAQEYAEAVQAVIDGFEYQQEAAEVAARSAESLRLWRRFYLGLRIAQRVNAIEIDGEKGPQFDVQGQIDREDKKLAEEEMAGGFFPDNTDMAEPTPRGYEPKPDIDFGGGFLPDAEEDDEEEGGGFIPDEFAGRERPSLLHEESFGSAILEQQELRPRRRSSFGEPFIPSDDDDDPAFTSDPSVLGENSLRQEDQLEGGFIADGNTPPAQDSTSVSPHSYPSPVATVPTPMPLAPAAAPSAPTSPSPLPPPSSLTSSGSLPLEDPEDEDADPDWLVDAT
jgi:xeroderma pigmentosum group C-complementing protein